MAACRSCPLTLPSMRSNTNCETRRQSVKLRHVQRQHSLSSYKTATTSTRDRSESSTNQPGNVSMNHNASLSAYSSVCEVVLEDVEHAHHLRENQYAVTVLFQLRQQLQTVAKRAHEKKTVFNEQTVCSRNRRSNSNKVEYWRSAQHKDSRNESNHVEQARYANTHQVAQQQRDHRSKQK